VIAPFLLAAALAAAPPTTIDLGGATRLYAQADEGAQLVGMQLVLKAGTARQSATQSGLAALTAETVIESKIDGVALIDRVTAAGGSLGYALDADVIRFTIAALPDALPGIARDLATVFAAPDSSPAAIAAARATLATRIDGDEKNPLIVGLAMLRGSYYTGGAALPTLGTRASLAALRGSDVGAFFAAHYRRTNAFVAATGRIDDTVSGAARTVLQALGEGTEPATTIDVRPLTSAGKQIITHRDIGIPVVLVGFAAPALGDRDFAAMLVVRALLGTVSERTSATTLSDFERGIAAIYDYDVKPATLTVAINGGRVEPAAGLRALRTLLQRVAGTPFDAPALTRYRDAARGKWLLEAISLTDRAWLIGAAVANGSGPSAAADVAAAIVRVTADDVQRVARTYLQRFTVATVLPRDGAPGSGS
jgi:predicted Zn-dependent peptidase